MTAKLKWQVSEVYDESEKPNAPLIWNHDPHVIDLASSELQDLKNYLENLAFAIAEAGYIHSKQRAACFALLSMIPHFSGPLDQERYNSLRYLFSIANDYLNTTSDLIAAQDNSFVPLRSVIFGNLYRVLLSDAEDQIPLEDWAEKASLYLDFSVANKGTRGKLWLKDWFPDIGWPWCYARYP